MVECPSRRRGGGDGGGGGCGWCGARGVRGVELRDALVCEGWEGGGDLWVDGVLVGAGVGGRSAMENLRCMSLRNCGRGLSWVERVGSGSAVRGVGREALGEERRWRDRRLEDRVALAAVVAREGGRDFAR